MALDWDNVFKMATLKYVYIRDWKLGVLKYSFMLVIFIYVIGYEICYSCTHLAKHRAEGHGILSLLEPTDDCDPFDQSCGSKFKNVADLPYCSQHMPAEERKTAVSKRRLDGKSSTTDEMKVKVNLVPTTGARTTKPQDCRYFDGIRSVWHPPEPSEIFVPLRYTQIKQRIHPNCYDPTIKGYKGQQGGRSKYHCNKPWETVKETEFYLADMESFKLTLDHSFSAPALAMAGTSVDFQGFVAACPTQHPKDVKTECKRAKIPNTSGEAAPEDLEGLISAEDLGIPSLTGTKDGTDEISLDDLLKVTPVAQQHKLTDEILDRELPADLGHPGKSIREAGGMLLLDVDYGNFGYGRPAFPFLPSNFGVKPVTYTYRPYFVPMPENVRYQVISSKSDPQNRIVDKWYGLTIRLEFSGKLVKFTMRKLLKAMTAGLVLLSAATSIVAALAAYILPLREKYCLLMYQLSEDFSDYNMLKHADPQEDTSRYATSEKLVKLIESKGKLSSGDILSMFCINEMRLNRLDGMDPKVVFDDDTTMDARNYCIGDFEREFYRQRITNDADFKTMSRKIQLERPEIEGGYRPVHTNNPDSP